MAKNSKLWLNVVLRVCIVLGLAVPVIVRADEPTMFIDQDGDGIDDNLEQRLANKFAPVIFIESDESNYPVNVDWFLARARLQYHEDCTFDIDNDLAGPGLTQETLLGPLTGWLGHFPFGVHVPFAWVQGPNCGQGDTGYSHPPHRGITTIATDPDGQVSAGGATTGYSDQQTFVLPDLAHADHVGSLDPRDWKTYFHAYPTNDGGIMLQYWHLFAYNALAIAGFGNHGGDWDATIHVQLGPDLQTVEKVWFSRHKSDHPGDPIDPNPDAHQMTFLNGGTHPLMTIDGGGHAAYASPTDFCANRSPAGGTAAWPTDIGNALDPAGLNAIGCCTNLICWFFSGDHPGGTVWETWDDGTVASTNNLTHQIVSPSTHGGMVNLGEYNPCGTPEGINSSCFGSKQASRLLAGQFRPLNDQIFIQYEGRWGSLPHQELVGTPPRGPVFQGFDDKGDGNVSIYQAWYNQGADELASSATSTWRKTPSTSITFTGPTYSPGGITYVSGTTSISFTVTPNPVAAGYGASRTYYRAYPVGGTPPAFVLATGAFTLASPDGAYQIDYYSMDALNNQEEPTKSLYLTLDITPPVVTITQPTAGNYPHSATLTLSYGVNDGAGSGVASVTPTLDGMTTVAGHGLASGQTINLLTELMIGTHSFTVTGIDHLGNSAARSVTFSIIVTPQSIEDDVNQFTTSGQVANNKTQSLLAKLDAAAAARDRRQCGTAANFYQAFIYELQAQSGKKVDAAAAAILINDAQYLIAHCP